MASLVNTFQPLLSAVSAHQGTPAILRAGGLDRWGRTSASKKFRTAGEKVALLLKLDNPQFLQAVNDTLKQVKLPEQVSASFNRPEPRAGNLRKP